MIKPLTKAESNTLVNAVEKIDSAGGKDKVRLTLLIRKRKVVIETTLDDWRRMLIEAGRKGT